MAEIRWQSGCERRAGDGFGDGQRRQSASLEKPGRQLGANSGFVLILFQRSRIDLAPANLYICRGIRRAPTHRWRGGRVAEGGGLLNRYTVNPVSWVRIPSPPPPSLVSGCLSQRTAAAPAWRPELVFLPRIRHCSASDLSQLPSSMTPVLAAVQRSASRRRADRVLRANPDPPSRSPVLSSRRCR